MSDCVVLWCHGMCYGADCVVLWCHGMCYACEVQCSGAMVLIVQYYGADCAVLWC